VSSLLDISDVKIYFPIRSGVLNRTSAWVKAVDGVTLNINEGEALGLVGESGCGKTTLVNGILMLEKLHAGSISFDGHDLSQLTSHELKSVRRQIQVVFQDPYWSLNPRWLVRDIVGEPLRVHEGVGIADLGSEVAKVLAMVGMPSDAMFKYPHEFSSGLRQRIAIARALALKPRLVVLDEPTSAIDVVSQHQILLMLTELKERLGLTFALVSHDLSVVRYLATKVAVMYLGKVAEWGPAHAIFTEPKHPYTQAMFAAVPDTKSKGVGSLVSLAGEVPSAIDPPAGCRFHARCSHVMEICKDREPQLVQIGEEHVAACWLLERETRGTESVSTVEAAGLSVL
jgi:oligopeptide/dipeptide ABC transporter ATP-binding protein